jgi:crossover junction endodeoxyribonuclease RuvC
MIFLGIDPGLSGAIARWTPGIRSLVVLDMPTLKLRKGSEARTLDVIALARIVDDLCAGGVTLALIEQAFAQQSKERRNSAATVHKNGINWGAAYGVLCAQYVPIDIVPANAWKAAMRCPAEKVGARSRASQELPQFASLWSRAKDDGRAEAALIALYAERRFRSRAVTP